MQSEPPPPYRLPGGGMELVAKISEARWGDQPRGRARAPDGSGGEGLDARPASELGDGDIVRACLDGRTELFAELVRRYTNVVATYLFSRVRNKELAEELTQEAMVRAFEFLPRLKAPRSFAGWLLGIAHNTMTRSLEERRRSVPLEDAILHASPLHPEDRAAGPAEKLSREELRERALAEVGRLPPRYRIPLMLKYQGEHSCEQIAEFLGVPVGTITSRLSRAYQMLYENLNAAVSGSRAGGPRGGAGRSGETEPE